MYQMSDKTLLILIGGKRDATDENEHSLSVATGRQNFTKSLP
jgi:hypothetical protein